MYFSNDRIVSEKLLNPLHNANVLYKIKSRLCDSTFILTLT